jgi:hypothetical protein
MHIKTLSKRLELNAEIALQNLATLWLLLNSTLTKVANLIHRNMVVLGVYCGCLDPSEPESGVALPPSGARSAIPRAQLRKLLKCIGIVREDDPGRGGAFLGHHRGHQHQQGAAVPARQPGGHRAGGHGAPLAPRQLSRKFPSSLRFFVEFSFFFVSCR